MDDTLSNTTPDNKLAPMVLRSLDMEPRPPFPKGFAVEQGDWSLLEPVKRRGRLYREVRG